MARKEELRPAATTTDTSGASPVQSNSNNTGASNDNDGDTSMTSANHDDDAAPSSSSSSSSESDSDSDSDSNTNEANDIATVTARSKPDFSARVASGAPSLEDRLKFFLPQLAEANGRLEQQGERAKFSMEDVGEGEPHIEMNLGLGVLKEVGGKEEESGSGSESESEEDGEEEEREMREKEKEKDVMGKLMCEAHQPDKSDRDVMATRHLESHMAVLAS